MTSGYYTADVRLDRERTLRVGVQYDHGEPVTLHLAVGTGTGWRWRETVGETLSLPYSALQDLVVTLGRLATPDPQ